MSAVTDLDRMATPTDFTRDRFGRPLIIPAKGGKPVAYSRASGAAKPIEDTYNLELWYRRNVAYGLATDPSLVARMLAVGDTPQTWDRDQKKAVNQIVDAANVVAKAHAAADTGTALHALIEKVNRGQDPGDVGMFAGDLAAYSAVIADLGWVIEPDLVEVRVVCDELKLAGTCDMLVWDAEDGCYYVADLKTGSSVEFGVLGHAAQLAAYANSELYDIATGQRRRIPINTEVGYIVHLPAGRGECTVHELNLQTGFEAAKLANKVRSTRTAAKKWSTPVTSHTADPTPAAVEVDVLEDHSRTDRELLLRDRVARILEAGHADRLVWRWPHGVPGFKSDHRHSSDELDRIDQACTAVETEYEMPFNPPPRTPAPKPVADTPTKPESIDEGQLVHDVIFEAVEQAYGELDEHQVGCIRDITVEAANAGYPISVSQKRSERRIAITEALIAWVRLDADHDLLAGVIQQITHQSTTNPGETIGQFTIEQADQFRELLVGVADGTHTPTFTVGGVQIQANNT